MTDPVQSDAPVVVIGAGPVGLAAAAHLAQRGIPFVLFEAGASVAAHVAGYAHVRLFSSWRYNINRAAREMLEL
ncbi:MAG: FAD-dependent oxidoreductase [Gammaproteobacteria bacterium]|nr:FAD-dependent oxidoreductase [Gammaproteobacteria bacterium]